MAKDKEAPKEQRQIDREGELAKQQKATDAMEKFYKEQRAEAEEALRRQGDYEVTGIRTVDSTK